MLTSRHGFVVLSDDICFFGNVFSIIEELLIEYYR